MQRSEDDPSTSPSLYHLLCRLLSLSYTSSPATSTFYADILFQLFPPDLVQRIQLPEYLVKQTASYTSSGVARSGKRRRDASASGSTEGGGQPDATNGFNQDDADAEPQGNGIDPHIALHAKAMNFFLNKEYYSALHVVRDHAIEDIELQLGVMDLDEQEREGKKTQEQSICMSCSIIMGKCCLELGRYAEGLRILEVVLEKRRGMGLSESMADLHNHVIIPSPLNTPGTTPLLLAQLSSKSNHDRLHPIIPDEEDYTLNPETGEEKVVERVKGESKTARYFREALDGDGWLWEAWTGLCDHGDVPDDYIPFTSSALDSSSPPTVPDHILPTRSTISTISNYQSNPHDHEPARARSLSTSASSPPPPNSSSPINPAYMHDHRERRVSPLPGGNSPSFRAQPLSASGAGPSGMGSSDVGFFTPQSGEDGRNGGYLPELPGPRTGKSKGRPVRGLSPGLSDISFPNLNLPRYGASAQASSSTSASGFTNGRNAGTGSLPHPSISSVLDGAGDNGLGKPPVAKRARAGAGGNGKEKADSAGTGLGRKATGRNPSGVGPVPDLTDGASSGKTVRRSNRLQSSKNEDDPAVEEFDAKRSMARTKSDSVASDSTSPFNRDSTPPLSDITYGGRGIPATLTEHEKAQRHADLWLLGLVNRCAEIYREMSRYNCAAAMRVLWDMPLSMKEGAWCLSMVARAFYEKTKYEESAKVYEMLRKIEPYRTKDMEWYSTVLYHLRAVPTLSNLSQTLVSISRESPSAWLASGNAFSITGSHEEAIRCFKRAFQLEPATAYAYTLAALEAVEMEEWERGIGWLQMAIRTDIRHYNAWYGLGLIYERTNKLRHAEYHFRRALSINPYNTIMQCCLGTVIEKRTVGKPTQQRKEGLQAALAVFEGALKTDPKSGMAGFRRVRCLVGLKRYQEALDALQPLSKKLESEASIFFLLGKLYLLLHKGTDATTAFTKAQDLNPKLINAIKSASRRKAKADSDPDDEDHDGDKEMETDAVRAGL